LLNQAPKIKSLDDVIVTLLALAITIGLSALSWLPREAAGARRARAQVRYDGLKVEPRKRLSTLLEDTAAPRDLLATCADDDLLSMDGRPHDDPMGQRHAVAGRRR
jgi:hypothetical protein